MARAETHSTMAAFYRLSQSGLRQEARRGLEKAFATAARSIPPPASRRLRRCLLGVSVLGGVGAVLSTERGQWLLDGKARAKRLAEQDALSLEFERKRQSDVAKLRGQVSWWRLAHILFIMLPVAFLWPVWLVDPHTFWSIVTARIDYCGPCFVKLAQWLAIRVDLFPESVCAAFARMHQQVTAAWSTGISSTDVRAALKEADFELHSLELQPHASGSIAEVFFGTLVDGTAVAVKCMRPGVRELLEADLAWLLRLSYWADKLETLQLLGVRRATEEFVEHVQMQTDFRVEADHLLRFRSNFADAAGLESVKFPVPLFVTPDTLVLSREGGVELARIFHDAAQRASSSEVPKPAKDESMKAAGSLSQAAIASAMARAEHVRATLGISPEMGVNIARDSMAAYMRMIFSDAFIHGDLHPGNIMLRLDRRSTDSAEASSWRDKLRPWLPQKLADTYCGALPYQLVILDAGLAIPLPREKVQALRSLAVSIIYADFARAAEILYQQSPDTSRCVDPSGFKDRLASVFRNCRKNVWDEGYVQVSETCLQALQLVQRYQVGMDVTLTWALFGMLSVEGSARQLDPNVDCAKAATRYIINMETLWSELQTSSSSTTRNMLAEIIFGKLGLDYWEIRDRLGYPPMYSR